MMSSKVLFPYLPLFVVCVSALSVSGQNILIKNRSAYQSSTNQNNEKLYGAQLALDGDLGTYSLAANDNDNNPAFWRVNLEDTYVVRRVTIIAPRQSGQYNYLESFIVTVDTVNQYTTSQISTCYQFSNATGVGPSTEITYMCERELVGNYVTVRRNCGKQARSLGIAEVKIEGTVLVGDRSRHRHTEQIDTYEQFNSSYAVDDDPESCALANDPLGRLAWWQVDLGSTFRILSVTISATYTARSNDYFQDVVITVDTSNIKNSGRMCALYNNGSAVSSGVILNLPCSPPLEGRYVTFSRRGGGFQNQSLGLCDVHVIGEYILATTTVTGSASTSNPGVALTTTPWIHVCTTPGNSTTFGSRLGSGAIAGILIGCIVFAALVVALGILTVHFYRESESTQSKTAAKYDGKPGFDSPTLHPITSAKKTEESNGVDRQVDSTRPVYENLRNSNKEYESGTGQYTPLQIVSVAAEFEASNCEVDYYNCK